jgi:hypothetical protein
MKLEIIIPESWEDVKLSKYLAYMKALKPYEGTEEFAFIQYEKALNYFCDISTEQIRSLPLENYNGLIAHLQSLFIQGNEEQLVPRFTIKGTEYGFIPDLDNMTYGEYLDLTTYSKDLWNNLPTLLSILYRPVVKTKGDKYEIEAYDGTDAYVTEVFNQHLTMNIARGAINFFTSLQNDLLEGTLNYSLEKMKKVLESSVVQETLKANGVDISHLQSLQTTISQSLEL